MVSVKLWVAAFVTLSVITTRLQAQTARSSASAIGVWRGTSTCLVRPSACNDELVVYRITSLHAPDSVSIDARKIVSGKEDPMGVLPCRIEMSTSRVTCAMPNGTWSFVVRNDSLNGDLRLRDSTRFRDVRTVRSHTSP